MSVRHHLQMTSFLHDLLIHYVTLCGGTADFTSVGSSRERIAVNCAVYENRHLKITCLLPIWAYWRLFEVTDQVTHLLAKSLTESNEYNMYILLSRENKLILIHGLICGSKAQWLASLPCVQEYTFKSRSSCFRKCLKCLWADIDLKWALYI